MMSKELGQFYVAYLEWIDSGAPSENEHNFLRVVGLCWNLTRIYGWQHPDDAIKEMKLQFSGAGLDKCYPFNHSDAEEYEEEVSESICHQNPKRIEWVRTKAAEFIAQGE